MTQMEDKVFVNRVLDQLQRCEKQYAVVCSDFLEPRLQEIAQEVLQQNGGRFFFWGGYPDAERKKLVLYPDYQQEDMALSEIVVLCLQGRFDFVKADHRDFLGAILSLGIKREKFGDLLLTNDGCMVFTTKEIAQYVQTNGVRVKTVPLKGEIMLPEAVKLPQIELQQIHVTLASMRLDTIVAHGFGTSRSLASELIQAGRVKVNHKEQKENDFLCQSGDVLSVRGKGKLKVGEITGNTKKGKLRAELFKYKGGFSC